MKKIKLVGLFAIILFSGLIIGIVDFNDKDTSMNTHVKYNHFSHTTNVAVEHQYNYMR